MMKQNGQTGGIMGEDVKKGRAFSKMFERPKNRNWQSKINVNTDEENAEEFDEIQDIVCEEAEYFNSAMKEKPMNNVNCITERVPEEKVLEKESVIKTGKKMHSTPTHGESIQAIKDIDSEDITTAMKENDKLSEKIKNMEEMLVNAEKEKEKYLLLYKELKGILISMGMSGNLEIFENNKCELNEKDKTIQYLETVVIEKENFLNKLKNNLLTRMTQLFEQNPTQSITNQYDPNETVLIQERPLERKQEIEEDIIKNVMKMHKAGKIYRQIAHITFLTVQKVEEIIKTEEEKLKNAS